jgi:hypothetical protein
MERAVILEGARTPIGKFLGSFADVPTVELGTRAAAEAMRRSNVEADQIDQAILGHARQAGCGPNTGRQVSAGAGVPVEVSAYNVNIACGSGMKAAMNGTLNLSVLDGWWPEGSEHGVTGWAIGDGSEGPDQDHRDLRALYETLEDDAGSGA